MIAEPICGGQLVQTAAVTHVAQADNEGGLRHDDRARALAWERRDGDRSQRRLAELCSAETQHRQNSTAEQPLVVNDQPECIDRTTQRSTEPFVRRQCNAELA